MKNQGVEGGVALALGTSCAFATKQRKTLKF